MNVETNQTDSLIMHYSLKEQMKQADSSWNKASKAVHDKMYAGKSEGFVQNFFAKSAASVLLEVETKTHGDRAKFKELQNKLAETVTEFTQSERFDAELYESKNQGLRGLFVAAIAERYGDFDLFMDQTKEVPAHRMPTIIERARAAAINVGDGIKEHWKRGLSIGAALIAAGCMRFSKPEQLTPTPSVETTPPAEASVTPEQVLKITSTPEVKAQATLEQMSSAVRKLKATETTQAPEWQPGDAEPRRVGEIDLTQEYTFTVNAGGETFTTKFVPHPQDRPDWFDEQTVKEFNRVVSKPETGHWSLQFNSDIKGVDVSMVHSAFAGNKPLPMEWAMEKRAFGNPNLVEPGLEAVINQGDKEVHLKLFEAVTVDALESNDQALKGSIMNWDNQPDTEKLRFYAIAGNQKVTVDGKEKTMGWGFSDSTREELKKKGGMFQLFCDGYNKAFLSTVDEGFTKRRIIAWVIDDSATK